MLSRAVLYRHQVALGDIIPLPDNAPVSMLCGRHVFFGPRIQQSW